MLFMIGFERTNFIIRIILLTEHIPKHHQILVMSMISVSDTFTVTIWCLYFKIFPQQQWQYLMYVVISLILILTLISRRYVKESPSWLLTNGHHKQLLEVFQYIAEFNDSSIIFQKFVKKNSQSFENIIEEVFDAHSREDSFVGAFRNNSALRKNFLLMTFLWISCSVNFYLYLLNGTLSILQDPLDLTIRTVLVGALGTVCSIFLMRCFGGRNALFFSFVLMSLASLVLMMLQQFLS